MLEYKKGVYMKYYSIKVIYKLKNIRELKTGDMFYLFEKLSLDFKESFAEMNKDGDKIEFLVIKKGCHLSEFIKTIMNTLKNNGLNDEQINRVELKFQLEKT